MALASRAAPSLAILRHGCLLMLAVAGLSGCAIFSPAKPYMPSRAGLAAGQSVTVQPNDNVYAIARAHNVSMRDLIVLNNLRPPYDVKPGMQLSLPVGSAGGSFNSFNGDSMPPPAAAPRDVVEARPLSGIEPAGVSSEALQPLSSGVTPAAAPSNTLPNAAPTSLVPAAGSPKIPPAPPLGGTVPLSSTPAPVPLSAAPQVKPLEAVASTPAAEKATAAKTTVDHAATDAAMIWPLQGPVLSGFGTKGPGLSNDGVNIGAPKGAPVVASASGTVVYAGNEMKGFGNLVLIRHGGDWVTAYAHLDRVMVKKDAAVAQGDEIGTVGKTGNVATPQLHFETRKNGKPVDPAAAIKSAG